MSQHLIDLFRTSCGASVPLKLNVFGPNRAEAEQHIFEHPFILIGRHERACLRLQDAAVSRRHAYLQQLGGRIFCIDLGSRTGVRWGGESRPAGWFRPNLEIQIGPFTLELVKTAQAGGVPADKAAENWDPLQDRVNDSQPLPQITVEMDNKVQAQLRMNRVLVLVGSAPACRMRLREAGIANFHCSLVRTPEGVWVVDLLSGTGTYLDGQPIRWALLEEGSRLQVGPYVLRVWYPLRLSRGPEPDTSVLPQTAELRGSAASQTTELEIVQAECGRLHEQIRALQSQIAEAANLQARLEAAEASAQQLEAVCAERDRWQAETQSLQAKLAADTAEREAWRRRFETAQQQLGDEREAVRAAGLRLDQQSALLQAVRADLAARNADYDVALRQLQETQEELARSQDTVRSLQAELDQVRERLRDAETLNQHLADVRAEHHQLCARISELEDRAALADRLLVQLQAAEAKTEQFQVQLRAANSQAEELTAIHVECARLREQLCTLEIQAAEATSLRTRLEAAEARMQQLETVCAERDRWQAEAQSLQAKLAADAAERETQHQHLEAVQQQLLEEREAIRAMSLRLEQESAALQVVQTDLTTRNREYNTALRQLQETQEELTRSQDAARSFQAELDQVRQRLRDAEALSQQLADSQAECARLHERIRALESQTAEAAGLQIRLETALRAIRDVQAQAEATIREIQTRAAAEREGWRQRLEGAESQILLERGLFQEQNKKLYQQIATLQAERDRLAARLAQTEPPLRAAEESSRNEAGPDAESEQQRQVAIRDQIFAELGRFRLGGLIGQAVRVQGLEKPAEQNWPRLPQ